VTALEFHGALGLSVGTATGQVLLYDLRSDKPIRVKDHMYGLPIRDVQHSEEHVLSMDSSVVKIWNRDTVSIMMPQTVIYIFIGMEFSFKLLNSLMAGQFLMFELLN
jgi:hypothetical protein